MPIEVLMTAHDPHTEQTEAEVIPERPALDDGKPSPVLIIFLVIPLLGILVALLMVAGDMRTQNNIPQELPPELAGTAPSLVNQPAPDFTLPSLEGPDVTLSDYRGRVVFVNFWQTTCPPCVEELPEFREFFADQDPAEVALLAVNVDETRQTIMDFFTENNIIGIPVVLDSDSSVRRTYGVMGYPVTFVINTEGVVRFTKIGSMTYDEMEDYLDLAQTTDPSVDG
ncbi:MAG: TlpA family protein disulfide reductase [Anaerolineae bacterium]|nr:TlpA family protein disulfide reductase [Anaerolineae bacterium]